MEIDKIICGNSFDVIKNFSDRYFDAVILDPPFGIGKVYNGKKEIANSPDEYWKFLSPMWNEIQRVIKVGGFIAVWQAQLYFKNFWTWFGDDIHIYCSAKNFVQLRKVAINYSYDPIIFKYFKSDEAILSPKSPKRNLDFFVSNTAKFVRETNSLAKKHPYPRPIDVVCEIVDNFVVEGGIVLDPFVGSGTTAVACKRSGRHFVGIEIDETYCSLAEERIRLNE